MNDHIERKPMEAKELKNKIGMQIRFLTISDKPEEDVINHLVQIANNHADQVHAHRMKELEGYLKHKEGCYKRSGSYYISGVGECTCGLDQAMGRVKG